MTKRFIYVDERIQDLRGNRFYLRTKYEKSSGYIVYTIRTQRYGKGKSLSQVRGLATLFTESGDMSQSVLLHRLAKKWRKFYFVLLVDIDGMYSKPLDK